MKDPCGEVLKIGRIDFICQKPKGHTDSHKEHAWSAGFAYTIKWHVDNLSRGMRQAVMKEKAP